MKKFLMALLLCMPSVLQAATHTVTLTWTPSSSTCVTTVNVHRVLTSGTETIGQTGSNYATVPVGTNTYTDTAVVNGTTYFYTVSAFGSSCGSTLHESVSSNEITEVIPTDPPAPPTGLTGTVQ